MAKTYFEWFNETFSIDQTNLVKNLISIDNSIPFTLYHCPDYYISNYDICLKNDETKDAFINKHIETIKKEKSYLQEIIQNDQQVDTESFFTSDKVQQIKECIQEIEIQTEILELIKQNLQTIFNSCKWFPFSNKTLFDIFNFAKLPLVACGNNYWVGVLPDKVKYERQKHFFSVLKTYELPDDTQLTITKLHTWVDIEYKKITINEPLTDFDKPVYDVFRIKARQIARQKVFDSWDKAYVAIHNREI